MCEHVAGNSRCANVRSLQYFQTGQIIVLIFCKLKLASLIQKKASKV